MSSHYAGNGARIPAGHRTYGAGTATGGTGRNGGAALGVSARIAGDSGGHAYGGAGGLESPPANYGTGLASNGADGSAGADAP